MDVVVRDYQLSIYQAGSPRFSYVSIPQITIDYQRSHAENPINIRVGIEHFS